MAVSTMEREVFEAFKSAGVPDDKAMDAATALNRRNSDITQDVAASLSAIKADVWGVKGEILVLKWMVGFTTALCVAILLKLFIH